MPSSNQVGEVLARVEGATGPDRELDARLAVELVQDRDWLEDGHVIYARHRQLKTNLFRVGHIDPGEHSRNFTLSWSADAVPEFTSSIDAALALVERKLPGWQYAMGTCGEEDMPWACLTAPDDPYQDFAADAPAIPLAILAALLRALANQETDRGNG